MAVGFVVSPRNAKCVMFRFFVPGLNPESEVIDGAIKDSESKHGGKILMAGTPKKRKPAQFPFRGGNGGALPRGTQGDHGNAGRGRFRFRGAVRE